MVTNERKESGCKLVPNNEEQYYLKFLAKQKTQKNAHTIGSIEDVRSEIKSKYQRRKVMIDAVLTQKVDEM